MGAAADQSESRTSRRTSFVVEPFTDECRSILTERRHVVLGVSPTNSYFNVGLLSDLLAWLRGEFARVDVVIPDSALEHTYSALGYDTHHAAKKARGEVNVVRNRVVRAWRTLGGPRDSDGLHLLSKLSATPAYRRTFAECERALAADSRLRETCAAMSQEVLSRAVTGQLTPERIELAVRYLVAELPFFIASAEIFDVPSSTNFYHQRLPLADLIFSGDCVLRRSPRQAYAVIRRAPEFPATVTPQEGHTAPCPRTEQR